MLKKQQIEKARGIDTVDFLRSQGYEFVPNGSYMRCIDHDSLVVRNDGTWVWNSKSLYGGNVIDFLMLVLNMEFREAIKYLLDSEFESLSLSVIKNIKKPFYLPPPAPTYNRVFSYLNKTRGIDGKIISKLMQEHKIYETQKYHNCACVGFDEDGVPKHVAMWGTYTKGDRKPFKGESTSSDKSYGFHMIGKAREVYVYESPIDAMSHATLDVLSNEDYERVHRLSLCCTWDGALKRFLEHRVKDKIVFCLDNDTAGDIACEKYMKEYYELGYEVERIVPKAKDFNEDLLNLINIKNTKGDIDNER